MVVNKAAENAFGILGTICWTIQLLPQIWKSYRTKSTKGLSEWLMLIWSVSSAFFGIYAILQKLSIPLILQQEAFLLFSLISWAQCQYYGRGLSKLKANALFFGILFLFSGFQIGMVYAIRPTYESGNKRPGQFFGIFTIVLTNCAILPQYYEIWKYKRVMGISLIFLAVDGFGGLFNDLSLAFKEPFDIVAGVSYSLVVVTDSFIIALAYILNPIADRRDAKKAAELEEKKALEGDTESDTKDSKDPFVKTVNVSDSDSSRPASVKSGKHDGVARLEIDIDDRSMFTPDLEKGLGLMSMSKHQDNVKSETAAVPANHALVAEEKRSSTGVRDGSSRIEGNTISKDYVLFRPIKRETSLAADSEETGTRAVSETKQSELKERGPVDDSTHNNQ